MPQMSETFPHTSRNVKLEKYSSLKQRVWHASSVEREDVLNRHKCCRWTQHCHHHHHHHHIRFLNNRHNVVAQTEMRGVEIQELVVSK